MASRHRERILQAAGRLFYREGYRATSVGRIVELAEVNPPTLYHHFGSKHGLALAYLEGAARQESERFQFLGTIKTFRGMLLAWAKVLREDVARKEYCGCPLGNFVSQIGSPEEGAEEQELRQALVQIQTLWIRELKALLDQFKTRGQIIPGARTEQIARRLLMNYEGALLMWRMSGDAAYIDELKRQFIAVHEQFGAS